ncbi:hypothetical protein TPDSL_10470 [Terrisporobacter petrolearius]
MGIEQIVNQKLNKYPELKKGIKRVYQRFMYVISPKIKSEGNVIRISPNDPNHEYFFGYYDKSPWDITDRYMLCIKAKDTWSDVAPKDKAQIIVIDTGNNNKATVIAETHSWNVQQGCMLQWLGPDYLNRVLFNDFRNGEYCSVILNLKFHENGIKVTEEKVIPAPVYSVSGDGTFALTLDFSRLHRLRPGYGYSNKVEDTAGEKLPDKPCIWRVDLLNGELSPLLKYTDFANFEPRKEMKNAEHKVNHIMLSPNGKRFMVLHRWFEGQHKYTRLVTCNSDGTDMYNLSDDDMVSHCYWKSYNQIIAFENKKQMGSGYYLMVDKTNNFTRLWLDIDYDGHPSYSPDGRMVVFDRYPDRSRMAAIMVSDAENTSSSKVKNLTRVFAPFRYDNDTRCDLHPRWNRASNKVCFDSVFEGHRGLYIMNVDDFINQKKNVNFAEENIDKLGTKKISTKFSEKITEDIKYSIITPVYNSFSLMERYFKSLNGQSYKNFEVILVDDGSTDGSYEKLIEYQKICSLKMKVLKTEKNSGPGYARNIGMAAANGEWITFIDNDDWVDDSLLKEIDNITLSNQVCCVIYDLYAQTENNKVIMSSMYKGNEGIIELRDALMYTRNHSVGKFYKRIALENKKVTFPILRRCEDVAFGCRAIEACQSVYYYKKPMYYYYQRSTSLSNNSNMDEFDMVKAFEIVKRYLGKTYPKVVEAKSVPDLLYGGVLIMCKSGKKNKEIKNYIEKYEKQYPNWKKSPIINSIGRIKRIYLKFIGIKFIPVIKLMTKMHSLIIK